MGVAEWHASGLEPPRPLLLLLRGGGVTLPEKIKAPMKMRFFAFLRKKSVNHCSSCDSLSVSVSSGWGIKRSRDFLLRMKFTQ